MHCSESQRDFKHNDYLHSNNEYNDNNNVILKKARTIRQLRRHESEMVKNCYFGAILRGFNSVADIQKYILKRCKILVHKDLIEYLRKSKVKEDQQWFQYMATDHMVYISCHRKILDEFDLLKQYLWEMMIDPTTTHSEKVQIAKEIHVLCKSYVLVLRDLPFITNLSKYYDMKVIDPNYEKPKHQYNQNKLNNENISEEIIEQKVSERINKLTNESGLVDKISNVINAFSPPVNTEKKMTDFVMDNMNRQLNDNGYIDELLNSKEYKETIRKIKEIED